jgi:dTDP-4-dehydrorhamnose 3,5-epimerase
LKVVPTSIPGVLVLEPRVFEDERGFFFESFNQRLLKASIGRDVQFVQDNHSRSAKYVLRGLHYQIRQAQGKLVRVMMGEVFDVAVDIRRSSPTLASGLASPFPVRTNASFGFRRALRMGSSSCPNSPSSFIRRRTIGHRNTNAALLGMTRPSRSSGRSTPTRASPQRTEPPPH